MKNDNSNLFDEEIDRSVVPALKVHPMVLGNDSSKLFAAGVADMDFKAPAVVLEALQQRLNHGVFGYETVSDGLIPSLMQWLARRHKWTVKHEHILRAPNILNILAIAASLFTEEGDGIIVQTPVFFDFFDIVHENKRSLVINPLILENNHYRMDFDDLEKKAANPRTKMIYLCNPHNPVGRVWQHEELKTLGDICARNNVLVVSDEMHGDLVFSNHQYTPFASLGATYADNCITCLSPAKTFNIASCCSAFTVISDSKKREVFQVENSRLTVNKNNAFANSAMEAAFSNGDKWLDDVLVYLEKNVALVRKYIDDIPSIKFIEPEGTFLLWLDFRGLNLEADDLTAFLRTKAQWAVSRGHVFGINGSRFARLNIACTYGNLKRALEQLKNAVLL